MTSTLVFFNRLFDYLSFGSSTAARYWFIVEVSLLSAVVFLYLFKLVSNQDRIKKYKNSIWGNILQMRIYQDRLGVIVSSILKVAGYNLLYLKEMLLPLVVLLPALAVFTIQVNNRCGYAPLEPGQSAAVRVVMAGGQGGGSFDELQDVQLATSGGLELQTPALRIPGESAVYWRVGAGDPAERNPLLVSAGGESVEKTVALAGAAPRRFDPVLCGWSWADGLAHNAEGFLPADSQFESISIEYPRQQYTFLWWDTDSLVVYFVLVLVFALAFKPLFRVAL